MIRLIFCITGMPGSGKSLVADAAKQLGLRVVSMGDVIREEAERRGVPKSSMSLGALMLKLRREEGSDVVAKRCLAMVRESKSSVLIEGLRS
ncbi:MAG TPA: AAA family ATPase, partial [Candidatus Methanomethylicus sp.]|nr:AAA family ATPase [Candidatus Methanomethylicus sp.]